MNPNTQTTNRTHKFRPSRRRLLITILLVLAALALAANDCPDPNETRVDNEAVGQVKQVATAKRKLAIVKFTAKCLGNEIWFTFQGQVLGSPPFGDFLPMTLNWGGPLTALSAPGGKVRENSVFFPYLTVDPNTGKTNEVTVQCFVLPGTGLEQVSSTVTAGYTGEQVSQGITVPLGGNVHRHESESVGSLWQSSPAQETIPLHPALQDDYYLWMNILWIRPEGASLTTDLCQGYADLLQSESTFFALRFPVQPPTLSYTEAYTLPVVFRGSYSPTLGMLRLDPYSEIFAAPLEYRPQYHTFLENELPAAPGERWLALGVASTPTITCPPGLDVSSGDWLFEPRFYLDLGGVENTCADCVLPLYYCYKGQESPFLPSPVSGDATSYQGWDITCLGPHPLRLETPNPTTPPFLLGGRHMATITATQTISFSHHVMNRGGVPVTVTLETSSTLGLNWGLYEDAAGQVPLVGPVTLGTVGAERVRYFYAFATVPEGTPSGAESLRITAADVSSPTLSTWTSDVLWVGDWVAPPLPPLWYRLYLPLVLR